MTDVHHEAFGASGFHGATPRLRRRQVLSRRIQLVCLWAGIPMLVLWFAGLVLAHFMAPPSPVASAEAIAHVYRTHTDRIRIWLAVSFFAFFFYFYFTAAIAGQTRRIEGRAPVLSYLQLGAIGAGVMVLILPWCIWETAAFRPMRTASDIYTLNDLAWVIFTFAWPPFTAQLGAIGMSILSDTRDRPVYPRWLGYFNIWVALTIVPDNMVVLFKHGPFDWRGFFPYWFPFILWGVWALVMMVMTTRAINQEASEDPRAEQRWEMADTSAAAAVTS